MGLCNTVLAITSLEYISSQYIWLVRRTCMHDVWTDRHVHTCTRAHFDFDSVFKLHSKSTCNKELTQCTRRLGYHE